MRTGSGTKGTRHYDWAMLEVTSDDTPDGTVTGAACCSSGGTATPARCPITGAGLGATGPTGCTGQIGDAATSTAPAKPTNAGTPTPRQHHDHNELQLPYLISAVPGCGQGCRRVAECAVL